MEKKTIKLAVAVFLTGFAFVLAACDLGDKNMWQTGAANRFRNTKFAPELQEVLPDSAASLLFAETQAGIERKLSPDSSWLQRSPDSLLAGYSFKHGGEYVIDKFNLLGGKDGEIRSRVEQAVSPLLSGFIDKTNEWVRSSGSFFKVKGFYSDANNTQTVHHEYIETEKVGSKTEDSEIKWSTGIIHPNGAAELFVDEWRLIYNPRRITSYSRIEGEDFVYYNNDMINHYENNFDDYEENFTYMEFKTNPQGKKAGTYIFVSDRRNFIDGEKVHINEIRYVSFEGDDNEMTMYHGSMVKNTDGGISFWPSLTQVRNGISASFVNQPEGNLVMVHMDIPALSGINTVYYTKHPEYNWFYGQGIDAGSNYFAEGYDHGIPNSDINIMWIELEPRLVFTGTNYALSGTEIMGSLGIRFPLTADPLEQYIDHLSDDMGISVNTAFPDHQEKYSATDGFVDGLKIGGIDLAIDIDNFDAIRTAAAAFFDGHREVFLQNK